MNKAKPNYNNGKIYKIYNDEFIYIGSTTVDLNKRLLHHIYSAKNNKLTSSIIINSGNYKIELIQHFPCNTLKQLLEREQYYIDNTINCINKARCKSKFNDSKEYYSSNKDKILIYQKQYRDNNSIKIKDTQKQYRLNNQNTLSDKNKQYRLLNKDKLKHYHQIYYLQNKMKKILNL